ncbi:MAG: type II secretion system minor pseudopilin GspK [Mariprofundaceae bacterium]|nr:type II secretion system minor pseudopilin GspK [Mariprofundaceae bacterium]
MSQILHIKQTHERGAALIIVLGLVAVIAGWAATAAYEDMVSLRRAENSILAMKAELACLSVFELAKAGLKQDARDGRGDNLEEDWAQSAVPFPIDDGLVAGDVVDVNRYLNLNDLVGANGQAILPMVEMTKRLFMAKDVDVGLVDALVDWMDADSIPFGPGGIEDSGYFSQDYMVKNAPLDRLNELRLIAGYNQDVMASLKDLVVVWPVVADVYSKVNINTVEVDVLLAMFPNLSDVDAASIFSDRPYDQLSGLQTAAWAQGAAGKLMFSRLSVSSDGFMVRAHALFGRADWREEYGLSRQGENLTLRWRERLLWQP